MAKTCMINRDIKRKKLSEGAYKARQLLKKIISSITASPEEKTEAVIKLNKKARDTSECRVRRRCNSCGRSRGVFRKYGLCRLCLRQVAMRGDVPGLTKSSW